MSLRGRRWSIHRPLRDSHHRKAPPGAYRSFTPMFIEYGGKVPRVAASAVIAPTAGLIGDAEVGAEASIWFGVVLRADRGRISVGARSAVEDNAVVHAREHHRTLIGDDVTIGHCAVLDDCTIESGALVGSNAVILG